MKNLYSKSGLVFLGLILTTTILKSQEVDTTYAARMNYIFQHLDKAKIPHGLLKDAALEMAELNYYNGFLLIDSNRVFAQNWNDIYLTLATAQIQPITTFKFPNPNKVDSIWFAKRKPGQITLAGLYYKYSRFSDDGANKVNIVNEQIYDKYVNGVWQNPYTVESVMAFAPAAIEYDVLNLNFLLPAELWLSNQKTQVGSIQIDAGDGLGYRLLEPNVPLSVQYAINGIKEIKFKIILTDNTILQSHSTIIIQSPVTLTDTLFANSSINSLSKKSISELSAIGDNSESDFIPPPSDLIPGWNLISQSYKQEVYAVSSTETFEGEKAKGYVTIKYVNSDKKIRKPLIVAEGFDTGMLNQPEKYYGDQGIESFKSSLYFSTDLTNVLVNSPEYDIVYIDWIDGMADMRLNSLLLQTVIRKVNEIKVAKDINPIEKNVVLGRSMGGVIARYALKKMENAGENHDTRLYVSHDAPHQGANVPLGFQAMVVHAQNFAIKTTMGLIINSVIAGNQSNLLLLNHSSAAKQLLANRINMNYQSDNLVFNQWQTELKNLGYPQNCRNLSISNGSECGNAYPILPSGNLFLLEGYFKSNLLGDILGMLVLPTAGILIDNGSVAYFLGKMPGSNKIVIHFEANSLANGGGNTVYKGKIVFKKKILWFIDAQSTITNKIYNAPVGLNAADQFPGGYYRLTEKNESATPNEILYYGYYSLSIKPGFSFIPTTSALDIGKGLVPLTPNDYYATYTGATPPPAPKDTPFDNFITAFSSGAGNNEEHISFTQRNGKWLADELNLSQPLANCNFSCNLNNSLIIGPECFNSNGSYSISNLPIGATVTWYVNGSAIIGGSNTANPVNLTANGMGLATLKATISNGDCGQKTINKFINVGIVTPQIALSSFNNSGNVMVVFNFKVNNAQPNLIYKWYVSNILVYTSAPGVGTYTFQKQCNTFFSVKCIASSNCLTSDFSNIVNTGKTCWSSYIVSPNPTSDELKISYSDNVLQNAEMNFNAFDVELYDAKGKKVKSDNSKNNHKEIILDTSNLPNGIYYLHIQQGNQLTKKQIIIQHE